MKLRITKLCKISILIIFTLMLIMGSCTIKYEDFNCVINKFPIDVASSHFKENSKLRCASKCSSDDRCESFAWSSQRCFLFYKSYYMKTNYTKGCIYCKRKILNFNCTVVVRSFGNDGCSYGQPKYGEVIINDELRVRTFLFDTSWRGIVMCSVNPATCTDISFAVFDTYSNPSAHLQLANYVTNLQDGTVIIGGSFDAWVAQFNTGYTTMANVGVIVSTVAQGFAECSKFTFSFLKGRPDRSIYFNEPPSCNMPVVTSSISGTNRNNLNLNILKIEFPAN